MKIAGIVLAAVSGLALFGLASAAPASAGHHWRRHRDAHRPYQSQDAWRRRAAPRIGTRRDYSFDDRWARYFGVGPNSYECIGYDCNW
jgi:hypothetical protein